MIANGSEKERAVVLPETSVERDWQSVGLVHSKLHLESKFKFRRILLVSGFSRRSQNGTFWAEIMFGSAHVKIGIWPKVGL